jgi:transposase
MPTRYDQDVRAKAIRLVRDHAGDYDTEWAVIREISSRPGMSSETLRKWLRQAEVDAGQAPTETAREIRELKRKNAELERTIEILKAATSFFAWECDPLRR